MKIRSVAVAFVFLAGPLALFASSSTDRKIEEAAKASYNYRTVLEDHVTVEVTAGVVTLSGTVNDEDDKSLAADTVENLPGVVRVENKIKVQALFPEHSDGAIAFKIRGRLLVKSSVSATNTKVAVHEGNVVLSGTADSLAQKELTEAYARDIAGVKNVTNDLVVSGETPGPTIGETIDDASITTQVKFALLSHKSTSALKTKVITMDGAISVSGMAGSEAEKALVTKLAQDVRGVKAVNNTMIVKN
jgi:osmotically-inducible protein OsmY